MIFGSPCADIENLGEHCEHGETKEVDDNGENNNNMNPANSGVFCATNLVNAVMLEGQRFHLKSCKCNRILRDKQDNNLSDNELKPLRTTPLPLPLDNLSKLYNQIGKK